MENNIPTADEFVRSRFQNSDKADFESNKRNLIEFAKIHVEAALKAASEKALLNTYKKSICSKKPRWKRVSKKEAEEGVDLFSFECQWKVSKSSIKNAYPLENIK
jgi:hypothetical protein